MNMTRKRSPRKKRNENEIHFDTMKWWMFSSAICGILSITLSDTTSITLQNATLQIPAQEQENSANTTGNDLLNQVTNDTHESTKIQSNKSLNTTISLNGTENVNNILKQYHSLADNVTDAIRAGNSSNLVQIHIRVIDKNDPVNGAPLSDIEKYKFDIDTEFSTQYEMVYNNNFLNDLDTSTEFEIITDNDIETTTDASFIATSETVQENNNKGTVENIKRFQDSLLETNWGKNAKGILQSKTFGSQFAVTTPNKRVLNETLMHNMGPVKKEENVTTHNVYKNNDCLKFENCSNATNTKVDDFMNRTLSGTVKSDSKPQGIAKVKNEMKYVDSNSEENLVGDVEIMSYKQFKLNKEGIENSTKPYLKEENLQYTTNKYYPLNENSNVNKNTKDESDNKTVVSAESRSSEIAKESTEFHDISSQTKIQSEQLSTPFTEESIQNVNTEKYNNLSVVSTAKGDIKISEELKNITSVTHKSAAKNATNNKGGLKNSTVLKMEHKNLNEGGESKNKTKVKDSLKNGTLIRNRNENKTVSEKQVSREVTTEEDYNSSYEADEDDDDVISNTGKKGMTEPLDMGPFGAIRDFAGSLVESLVERIIPKGIRDLMKRMQNQNDQLETIKLRSREENGGLGQFGRSLLKGLTLPLNLWMQGVRDYGSLDSDRNFFSDVASGVASVADSVGDAFKDRVKAIFPGTLWCGDGDMAKSAEVGLFFMTDTCCRRHDTCRLYISAGHTMYGLTNTGLFTRSHCECDKAFYRCLKRTNSLISSQIGVTYFSILGPQCFKREHPIMRCSRRTRLTGQKCEEYDLDYSQPKMWQWFDTETF